jgi:hypothetical protein
MMRLKPTDSLLNELRESNRRLVFIGGMGFEERALGFLSQIANAGIGGLVLGVKYLRTTAKNKEAEFKNIVRASEHLKFSPLIYSPSQAHRFEIDFDRALKNERISTSDIVVLDISALSKFIILICLIRLWRVGISVRVVMTAAASYCPTREEFASTMDKDGGTVRIIAGQPSVGASEILRSSCLVSPRMQGQPACAVAFTSFNEELIRHAVGTMNPHRLILINGMPPSQGNVWRARATQAIHARLIEENVQDNPINANSGLLIRTVSTLYFEETLDLLDQIHQEFGLYERMIYFATGSKMQTVGLAMHKLRNDDVHIEYPNPSSYYFEEYSTGLGESWSVNLDPIEFLSIAEQNDADTPST